MRRLKSTGASTSPAAQSPAHYEVRRILKAFVDAQWLADFEARLAGYRTALSDAKAPGAARAPARENADV